MNVLKFLTEKWILKTPMNLNYKIIDGKLLESIHFGGSEIKTP
jgi:hypothetical protein